MIETSTSAWVDGTAYQDRIDCQDRLARIDFFARLPGFTCPNTAWILSIGQDFGFWFYWFQFLPNLVPLVRLQRHTVPLVPVPNVITFFIR